MQMVNECISKDDLSYNRCKYVVEEITRLQTACEDLVKGDVKAFGKEMFATHDGLSREYEVSCKELDYLVDYVRDNPAVIGARMMGGGFGGCTINIIHKEAVNEIVTSLSAAYLKDMGKELKHYLVNIEDGTSVIK